MAKKRQRIRRSTQPRQLEEVVRVGLQSPHYRDLYHWFLRLPLPTVAGLCVGVYLLLNLIFALLYQLHPDGIGNARPGSLADAFFFSVQTIATIGYGNMYPKATYTNVVVTVETVTGLLYFALITGLLFTRFSRPSARVQFTRFAVVSLHDGAPTLMFRMANERRNQILQAEVEVTLLRPERSPEGTPMWRQRDLKLERGRSSFFGLSWTVFHRIDESSPLWGETADSLRAKDVEIVVLLAGVDEVLSHSVYARYTYDAADIRWGYRFADILEDGGRGQDGVERIIVNMTRFHDLDPAPLEKPVLKRAGERA